MSRTSALDTCIPRECIAAWWLQAFAGMVPAQVKPAPRAMTDAVVRMSRLIPTSNLIFGIPTQGAPLAHVYNASSRRALRADRSFPNLTISFWRLRSGRRCFGRDHRRICLQRRNFGGRHRPLFIQARQIEADVAYAEAQRIVLGVTT